MKMITNSIGLNDLVSALKSFHIITMMGGQDIRQRYKRSRLGPFWITISMAVMITTMGLVFGNLFKTDVKEFLPFLTLGLIIWSFIEPTSASLTPTCSSENLGHSIPGVSNSSTFLLSLIHCLPLVTPGIFPVLAQLRPA